MNTEDLVGEPETMDAAEEDDLDETQVDAIADIQSKQTENGVYQATEEASDEEPIEVSCYGNSLCLILCHQTLMIRVLLTTVGGF